MADSPLSESPYEVLGVSADADAAALRLAYRRALRTAHPDTGGDPARTATGYALNGTLPSPLIRPYPNWTPKGMIGPQLCGAMCDPAHQTYLNALWAFNANNFSTAYYDAELQLIPMLVASGNWWQP